VKTSANCALAQSAEIIKQATDQVLN